MGGAGFSFGVAKPGSGKRTLKSIKTTFYVGTEDGEIVYADWMPQKDQDTGKIQSELIFIVAIQSRIALTETMSTRL